MDKIMPCFSAAAVRIVAKLHAGGYEAYIVGGAVRDGLLRHHPKDYDITTSATPEEVLALFTKRSCRIIGRRFRLCHVCADGEIFEVSTFRREPTFAERKNRPRESGAMIWSDNQYGTMEEDVQRRDFTVNALYYDPRGKGRVIDKTGGLQDLEERIVRMIGDPRVRFQEDPVRMLRAVKLVGQHGFSLEAETEAALRELAPMLGLASQARMLEEIFKLMQTGRALPILEQCKALGLLKPVLPELDAIWEQEPGRQVRELLSLRDECLREDPGYPKSHSLSLLSLCYPYLVACMPEIRENTYRRKSESGDACGKNIRQFFQFFKLPHYLTVDIRNIALMLPYLAAGKDLDFCSSSDIYQEAWEFYRLLTMQQEWNVSGFLHLPIPEEPEVSPRLITDNIHVLPSVR